MYLDQVKAPSACRGARRRAVLLGLPTAAGASHVSGVLPSGSDRTPFVSDAPLDAPQLGSSAFGGQHGGADGHLPPVQRHVKLVSKLSPTSPFGKIVPGQIADLDVFKGWAYLNSWQGEHPECNRGGTYVLDIRKPKKPREVTFIPALPGNYLTDPEHPKTLVQGFGDFGGERHAHGRHDARS